MTTETKVTLLPAGIGFSFQHMASQGIAIPPLAVITVEGAWQAVSFMKWQLQQQHGSLHISMEAGKNLTLLVIGRLAPQSSPLFLFVVPQRQVNSVLEHIAAMTIPIAKEEDPLNTSAQLLRGGKK